MRGRPIVAWGLLLALTLALGLAARAQEPSEIRTWTDSTGKFRIEAALMQYADGKAQLKTKDGRLIVVGFRQLSAFDQRYLRRELARRSGVERESTRPEPTTSAPATTASATPAAANADWPGWRGALRDGKSPDTGLLGQWPAGGPPLLWKVDTIGKGFSTVAVVDGTVYTSGHVNDRLMVFAFDLDGRPKWQADHDAGFTKSYPGSRSTPMIDNRNLYIVSGNGLVGCYDATTGRPKWGRQLREFGGSVPGWGYAESLLIHDNLAIVTPGGQNCIVALDKNSGRPVWNSQGFNAGAQYGSCYGFTYQGVSMVVTGTTEGLVCVDARNGGLLWSHPFSARNTANCPTPVFADGYVFWASGYGKGGICLKLSVRGGQVAAEEAWTTRDMVCHHGGYIIHEGHVYGNNGNGYACLDLRTGAVRWKERAVGKGSLCFADGMLYLFSEDGGQAALATCSPAGLQMAGNLRVAGDGPSWAHPVVIGGRLYLRYDRNLYCYDVRAGG